MLDLKGLDFNVLAAGLEGAIVEGLRSFSTAAAGDLKTFAAEIARDMAGALLYRDQEWSDELQEQARVLLEVQRIRLNGIEWAVAQKILNMVFKGALAVLKAGI